MTIATILDKKGRDVFSLQPDTSLRTIVELLSEKKIGVVLLAEDGVLKGILSERDVVRALSASGSAALEDSASVHMTCAVKTCTESDTIVSVMAQMTSGRFRHMPVLEGGKIVGLVSIGDVVKHRIEQTEKEAEDMRAYIAAG